MVIWKFPLEIVDSQALFLPKGAKILSVHDQAGVVCLWALVDPDKRRERRVIELSCTGGTVRSKDDDRKFIGTVVSGIFVWHFFERVER